jgi:hypothetical protein
VLIAVITICAGTRRLVTLIFVHNKMGVVFFLAIALFSFPLYADCDAIDWSAMLKPGSVMYYGDVRSRPLSMK